MYQEGEIGNLISSWKLGGEFDEFGNLITSNFVDGEYYPELSQFDDYSLKQTFIKESV